MASSLKRNMLWNSAGSLIYLMSQWLITVLVTRLFGYADAGVLSLAMSISATFQTISLFGIRNFQVSDIRDKYSDSTYVMLRNITCTAALIFCMGFAFINRYSVRQILAILFFMLFRLSENYSDVLHGIAQKNGRLDVAGKGFAIKGVLIFAAFIGSYFLGASLNLAIAAMAAAAWLTTILFDALFARKIRPFGFVDSFGKAFSLGKETYSLCIYLFLSATMLLIPKYFLEMLTDEATLGAYASISAPSLIISAVAGYIFSPFIDMFAKLYESRDNKRFLLLALKIAGAIALFGLCSIILAYFLGDFALKIIFGESILEFSYMLIPTLIATILSSLAAFLYMLSIVVRDFKNLLISCFGGCLAAALSSPLMINALGANGTSFAMIIGAAFSTLYLAVTVSVLIKKNKKEGDMNG